MKMQKGSPVPASSYSAYTHKRCTVVLVCKAYTRAGREATQTSLVFVGAIIELLTTCKRYPNVLGCKAYSRPDCRVTQPSLAKLGAYLLPLTTHLVSFVIWGQCFCVLTTTYLSKTFCVINIKNMLYLFIYLCIYLLILFNTLT